jgi:heme A synthase
MTQDEWAAEFAKYQASPEFRLAHSHMTVEDFKFIYFMEWAHRMWGRCVCAVACGLGGWRLGLCVGARTDRALCRWRRWLRWRQRAGTNVHR